MKYEDMSIEEKRIYNYVWESAKNNLQRNNKFPDVKGLIFGYIYNQKMVLFDKEKTLEQNKLHLFFAYKNKYGKLFQDTRRAVLNHINKHKKSKKAKDFKARFSTKQWEQINGDNLLRHIALDDNFSSNEESLESIYRLIKYTFNILK